MTKLTRLSLVALFILVSGCAQYSLQKPGSVSIEDKLKVTIGSDWSRLSAGSYERWTVDGLGLQELAFLPAVEDGEAILPGGDGGKLPKYKSGMTPIEVAETVKSSLAIREIRDFRIQRLRPFQLGGEEGFRFEFSFTNKQGLDKLGFVAGVERKKVLTLIFYSGTRLHYHDKLRGEAENIVSSLTFL